jgi:hypothetical protein
MKIFHGLLVRHNTRLCCIQTMACIEYAALAFYILSPIKLYINAKLTYKNNIVKAYV